MGATSAVIDSNKNRYANSPRNADWTIDQQWDTYSAEEHDPLGTACSSANRRSCPVVPALRFLERRQHTAAFVPVAFQIWNGLSDRLEKITGWRVVPVVEPGTPMTSFSITWRTAASRQVHSSGPRKSFDYLEEPDIFHDIFGHIPLLANPSLRQVYGGLRQGWAACAATGPAA